jgi:hypothetical protein
MARNRKKKFNETQIYLDGIALNDELNKICLNMQRDYRNVYFPILSNNCYAFLRAFLKVYDENNNDLKYKLCRQLFSRIREIELSIDAVWRLHILTDKQYYKIRKILGALHKQVVGFLDSLKSKVTTLIN